MEKTGKIDEVARFEAEQDLVLDAQFLIQELLDQRGMTRKDVAQMLGVSTARLSQLMRADANPTLRTIAGIAHALGTPVTMARRKQAGSRMEKADNCFERADSLVATWSAEPTPRARPAVTADNFDFTQLLAGSRFDVVVNDNHARRSQDDACLARAVAEAA